MSPLFPNVQSTLDLNGPVLSFTTQPTGAATSVASGIATFVGVATATFPQGQTGRNDNTGTLSYQWYKGSTPLVDGANITGSGTTTLTLSGLTSPNNDITDVFLKVDYVPSAYTVGVGKSTANAINEPLDSNTGTVTVLPTISVDTQPVRTYVTEGNPTSFSVAASASDESNSLFSYQWYLNGAAISGATSSTLSITRPNAGFDKVYCEIKHSTAQPGIVTTTEVDLDVASARSFIKWEQIGVPKGTTTGKVLQTGARDLASVGPFWARADVNVNARILQVWSPEKDLEVKVTMGGAGGGDRSSYKGGEGGISVFKMTLKKNTEYTVKLGINSYEGTGGSKGGINGGGGSAIIYEKAEVIAVCGGGGGAGTGGNGGDGGGLNVVGKPGGGGGGAGGVLIPVGKLESNGHTQAGPSRNGNLDFDNGNSGSGRLAGCTQGKWWVKDAPTPTPPCDDVGDKTTIFYGNGGVGLSTTTGIKRGYKAGQGFRNNGGAGSGNGGGGGAGARGGEGTGTTGGGGGGSGYYASTGVGGAIKLLSSTTLPKGTESGGNDDVAFIVIEPYNKSLDGNQEPYIPPKTGNKETRTVNWNPSRNAGDKNTLEFIKVGGADNDRLRFGPNADQLAQNSQIVAGTVYQLYSANNESGRGLTLRIQNNQLQAADNPDNLNFSNLVIAPDQGVFSSGSTLPVKIQGTAGEGSNPQPNIRWTANW